MVRHEGLAEMVLQLQVLVELNVGRLQMSGELFDAELHEDLGRVRAIWIVDDICGESGENAFS